MIKTKELGSALAGLPTGTPAKAVGISNGSGVLAEPSDMLKVGRVVNKEGIIVDCNTVLENVDISSYQWSNAPFPYKSAIMETRMYSTSRGMQRFYLIEGANPVVEMYIRGYVSGAWGAWKKIG